ncbi:MAG: hypothetical protein ACTHJJ_06210 [Intrasporangium sp.]|uniref:hypothetical protein n=1 Tax=Intrasporangium sp. TaxID=1925024 RepID=UPI003F802005
MDVLQKIILVLHLLGMAAIVGGWVATRGTRKVSEVVVWGARAQLVTGLVLVGLAEATKDEGSSLNHTKIGIKLLIAICVVAFAEIGRARAKRGESSSTALDAAGAGGVLNVLVAALW